MRLVELTADHQGAFEAFAARISGEAAHFPRGMRYYGEAKSLDVKQVLLIEEKVGEERVVAGALVKTQDYVLGGEVVQASSITYPVSLGAVDQRYAAAGMLLFRHLLKRFPANYLLGMGPPAVNNTASLCEVLGWKLHPQPYAFMPRRLTALAQKQFSSRPALSAIVGASSLTGAPQVIEAILRRRLGAADGVSVLPVPKFGADHDRWWRSYAASLGFGMWRSAEHLNALCPPSVKEFQRLTLERGGETVGFAVILVPAADRARAALGANVVTLVDFAASADVLPQCAAALGHWLWDQKLDAVLTNTTHARTFEALCGFGGFRAKETYSYLALSPKLHELLVGRGIGVEDTLISRIDGDGPIGLGVDL